MYPDELIDHFMNPRNVGRLDNPDGEATVGDPACGDAVRLGIKTDGQTIADIRFQVFGCPAAIGTTSIFTEFVKGKSLHEAYEITDILVADAAGGLTDAKMHCSNLAVAAFRKALDDYLLKHRK